MTSCIKNINKYYCVILFIFSVPLLLPAIAGAAELYVESSEDNYYVDETFVVDARINVEQNESINAIEGYIEFPNDVLEIKDFSTGNSILTFIEEPKINQEQGLISFVGIIPGGYSGRIPGDPEKSNLLGKIIFQAVSSGSAQVLFQNNSEAFLSDGKGTPANLTNKELNVEIKSSEEIQPSRDEWQEELKKDKIPPEDFKPEIVKINGKYYLTFTTKDKNSGIDYYEILEKNFWANIDRLLGNGKLIEASSPYLLKDQSLSSKIEVKAVDKADNERIVELPATYSLPWYKNYFIWVIILVILSYLCFKLWPYLKTKQH